MAKNNPPNPDPLPKFRDWFPKKKRGDDDDSSYFHRLTIGALGGALPFLLLGIVKFRPFEGGTLGSLSAYYYSGAVATFAGVLFALSVYFFTYQGYKNERKVWDRATAIIAGLAAIGVAFFPTEAPDKSLKLSWWTEGTGWGHLLSAGILFLSFAFFALVLFPWSKVKKEKTSKEKPFRNFIYRACGLAILFFMAWDGYRLWVAQQSHIQADVFWQESGALWAFSLSWLVKAHAEETFLGALDRGKHYVVHPVQFLGAVKKTLLE